DSIPGQANFIKDELRKETLSPFALKEAAAAFSDGSSREIYSLPPGTFRSSIHCKLYCLANAMDSSGVLPISSVMALIRERSKWRFAHNAGVLKAAARSSRLVIRTVAYDDSRRVVR